MTTVWVGDLMGELLVYDAAMQLPACPHVFLWSLRFGEMSKYQPAVARAQIKPVGASAGSDALQIAYGLWKAAHGAEWIEEERQYYAERTKRDVTESQAKLVAAEAARMAALSIAERHREHLQRLGKGYLGLRKPTPKPQNIRVTHCYSCKGKLDNMIDMECVACGWILCRCGACGCGYVPSVH